MQTGVSSNINSNPNQMNNPYPGSYQEKLQGGDLEQNAQFNSQEGIRHMMRLGFIRKVYGILSMQLVLTVCIMSLSFIPSMKDFLLSNLVFFWIALCLSLVIVFPLICFRSLARQVPMNYILLFGWTLCEGYMLAVCCATYKSEVVMLAGVMTAGVTIALTIYAMTTKTDFTYCGGLLFCLGTILFIWGIFSLFIKFYFETLYCVLGILVYSIYLIYDTQLVMGKFGNEYGIDDYVIAALMIYIDIIQLFLYILQLLGRK